jgi:hypothetical protein
MFGRGRLGGRVGRVFDVPLARLLGDELSERKLRFLGAGKLFGLALAGRSHPTERDVVGRALEADAPELVRGPFGKPELACDHNPYPRTARSIVRPGLLPDGRDQKASRWYHDPVRRKGC